MFFRATLPLMALFSMASQMSFASDCYTLNDLYRTDDSYQLRELARNHETDLKVTLAYLLSKQIPDKYNCSFDLRGRINKEFIKYVINRLLINDILDVSVSVGDTQFTIISNDQALEVGYYLVDDLVSKKCHRDVLSHAARIYVREKIVGFLLWLLDQTEIEGVLPDELTTSEGYDFLKREAARYGVDELLGKAC